MGAGNLTNCPRCGKLYVQYYNEHCPICVKEIEEEYSLCADYLREHKLVSMYELSEATGVSVRQITKFIKEGRISIADNPAINYPCETCGTPIREGRFCKSCSERLNKDIKKALGDKTDETEGKKEANFYFQIKDRFHDK